MSRALFLKLVTVTSAVNALDKEYAGYFHFKDVSMDTTSASSPFHI